jgi:hypothetical protein
MVFVGLLSWVLALVFVGLLSWALALVFVGLFLAGEPFFLGVINQHI